MQHDVTGKKYQSLLNLYNQEIDTLKEKLLIGESWENLKANRKNIRELAPEQLQEEQKLTRRSEGLTL